MAAAPGGYPITYGMTGPLSQDPPTEQELALTEALVAELKKNNNYEAPEVTQKRIDVLNTMQKVTEVFVRRVGEKKGYSQNMLKDAGGRVFTFGSYRLGVYGPGSDIDTLIVGPRHCSREDFFELFPKLLQDMSPAGAIEELTPVPDAFVPIITLEYLGISIDLLFARLAVSSIPQNLDLKNNDLLKGLDETDMRCVNGTRVTDEILTLVPETKTFRVALRTVKLWAQQRAIYANVMGFPGGVAWAMMVARICQMYPKTTAAKVLVKFFTLMSRWPWPNPVLLKVIEEGPFQARIWNPIMNRSDKNHLMPIITPAFPSMCATHNITHSTKTVITQELARARELTEKIFDRKLSWNTLFERHTFFSKDFKYYLSVISASRNKEAQQVWSGLVESKVRRLVASIELSQEGIELARPYTKGFERIHEPKTKEEVDLVLQGSLAYQASNTKTETTDDKNDAAHIAAASGNADNIALPTTETPADESKPHETIYTTTYYIGIDLKQGHKSLDISYSTNEFTRQCKEWAQYNEEVNSIRVVYTRNYDLPDDVFIEGEERPVKAKKVKSSKGTDGAKKRNLDNANLQAPTENGDTKRQRSNGALSAAAG